MRSRVIVFLIAASLPGASSTRCHAEELPPVQRTKKIDEPWRVKESTDHNITWVLGGVGVLAILGGLRFRWMANQEREDAWKNPSDPRNLQQANRYAKISTVLTGLGALAIGTGAGFLIFSPGEVHVSKNQPSRFLGHVAWGGVF